MAGIINNDHIRELCNDLVLAVEQDVKQRLITRWQAEQSVHQAIKQLRRAGYKIVCDRVGFRRPKYKLAS